MLFNADQSQAPLRCATGFEAHTSAAMTILKKCMNDSVGSIVKMKRVSR